MIEDLGCMVILIFPIPLYYMENFSWVMGIIHSLHEINVSNDRLHPSFSILQSSVTNNHQ